MTPRLCRGPATCDTGFFFDNVLFFRWSAGHQRRNAVLHTVFLLPGVGQEEGGGGRALDLKNRWGTFATHLFFHLSSSPILQFFVPFPSRTARPPPPPSSATPLRIAATPRAQMSAHLADALRVIILSFFLSRPFPQCGSWRSFCARRLRNARRPRPTATSAAAHAATAAAAGQSPRPPSRRARRRRTSRPSAAPPPRPPPAPPTTGRRACATSTRRRAGHASPVRRNRERAREGGDKEREKERERYE